MLSLSYTHKVADNLTMATEFLWNWNAREATAAVGYDYTFRTSRVRGRIDGDGKLGVLLEERLQPGITFSLSGEMDHYKKDHKFGIGFTLGEM